VTVVSKGVVGNIMLVKCANPDCQTPFDYREGQLVRFCISASATQPATTEPHVAHFWLCGRCSAIYVLKQESGKVQITRRDVGPARSNRSERTSSLELASTTQSEQQDCHTVE